MKVSNFFKNYFNGFQDISNYQKNNLKTNVLAAVKILSYFTVVIPLGFAAIYGAASLYGRVSKKESLSSHDKKINDQARIQLNNQAGTQPKSKTPKIVKAKQVHSYTADLTPSQKSKIQANFTNDKTLQIDFEEAPNLKVTVRREDIFESHAEVIINAANKHLGGGGGIDGAIHKKGGDKYKEAHRELQKQYNSEYISGHAALIGSGDLKGKYNIDNVIVVAGPQGETSPEKESELYSCYYNSLALAENQNKTSVAFPSISTGIYGFPKDRAACISLKAIHGFIEKYPNTKLKNISIHFLSSEPKKNLETYKNSCS